MPRKAILRNTLELLYDTGPGLTRVAKNVEAGLSGSSRLLSAGWPSPSAVLCLGCYIPHGDLVGVARERAPAERSSYYAEQPGPLELPRNLPQGPGGMVCRTAISFIAMSGLSLHDVT